MRNWVYYHDCGSAGLAALTPAISRNSERPMWRFFGTFAFSLGICCVQSNALRDDRGRCAVVARQAVSRGNCAAARSAKLAEVELESSQQFSMLVLLRTQRVANSR